MSGRTDRQAPSVMVVHSSNELYGADRMLLRVIDALSDVARFVVLLPDDVRGEHALDTELRARGIETHVRPLPIIRRAYLTPRAAPAMARRAAALWRDLRRERPDVVWCATSAALLAAPLSRLAGVKRVILHSQEIWGTKEKLILAPLALFSHHIVSISQPVARSLPRLVRGRSVVVPNATDDPGTESKEPADATSLTFLVASRWNRWKGHETLLRAWSAAGEPGQLVIAGGPPPVGERVDVPALIVELGLTRVHVVGEVSSLSDQLAGADVVVVPSDGPEPFGLVAIEAFAAGRPVVGSRAGGLGDIVREGVEGWLFENRSVPELTGLLRSISPSMARAAGRRARERWEETYSPAVFRETLRRRFGAMVPDSSHAEAQR